MIPGDMLTDLFRLFFLLFALCCFFTRFSLAHFYVIVQQSAARADQFRRFHLRILYDFSAILLCGA